MKKGIICSVAVLTLLGAVFCGCGSKEKVQCGTLDEVVSHLKNKKLISGESIETEAAAIGAQKGVKYEDSQIELYVYDMNSKAYKGILENKKVAVEGFNVELDISAVNGKFVIFCENADNKDEIIDAFKEISAK